MAQLLVRNIENQVKARLKRRAARHRRSMEAEARDILRRAAMQDESPLGGLGSEIAALFSNAGLRAAIPELRGNKLKPSLFD